MPDGNNQGVRDETIARAKRWFSVSSVVLLTVVLFIYREQVSGWIAYAYSYLVWSLNVFGRIIPPQGVWIGLLVVIVYFAVGSFYGKRFSVERATEKPTPFKGQVEAMAEWIDEKDRGVYFKWRIAHLLGRVHEAQVRNTSGRISPAPQEIASYFDAGLNHSYMDYPTPGVLKKYESTPLDINLEAVLDYLEEQMEINR